MKARCCFAFLVLFGFSLVGCAAEQRDEELNADAFNAHFADQRACGIYIDHLVRPLTKALAAEATVEGMRSLLQENASDRFAALVARVQGRAAKDGPLDPRREADQLKVTGYLFDELSKLPDFEQSRCSTDVREAVMEALYLGIGGQDARVIEQLLRAGAKGNWEQRWVLLTALMAGTLAPGSI
jgi:hypothetical protein